MKIKYLVLIILFLFINNSFAGSVIDSHKKAIARKNVVSGGTTITIGNTTCGASSCDYSGASEFILDIDEPDTNRSGVTLISIDGDVSGGEAWGIVHLDLTAFNTAVGGVGVVTITDVKLYIYPTTVDNVPVMNVTSHQMLTVAGGASYDDTNATWNERDASGNIQWAGDTGDCGQGSGTDWNASYLTTNTVGDFTLNTWGYFSSASLTTLVDDWHEGTADSNGIILIGDQGFAKLTFPSGTYGTANQRCYWEITYE